MLSFLEGLGRLNLELEALAILVDREVLAPVLHALQLSVLCVAYPGELHLF